MSCKGIVRKLKRHCLGVVLGPKCIVDIRKSISSSLKEYCSCLRKAVLIV